MKSISVAQLRQNPTAALEDVQHGEEYEVTRHRTVIARLVPPGAPITTTPRKRTGGANLAARKLTIHRSIEDVDQLIEEMRSDR
jgi:antitoxin (DNA-binding transcriptional repressor) of toxin-antitoxin stability system